jgi:hypothetical protein
LLVGKIPDSSPRFRPTGAIIWAVGRPTDPTTTYVNLYAYEALSHNGTYKLLFSSPAGSWPNTPKNANIVPVVANGKVYVAANQSLTIFGTPPASLRQYSCHLVQLVQLHRRATPT